MYSISLSVSCWFQLASWLQSYLLKFILVLPVTLVTFGPDHRLHKQLCVYHFGYPSSVSSFDCVRTLPHKV